MAIHNTVTTYGSITKSIHWALIVLVGLMLGVGFFMEDINNEAVQGLIFTLHKLIGLLILVIIITFIIWSCMNVKPLYPSHMPSWEKGLARTVHLFLYLILILLPLTGWFFTTAAGRPPNFFGLLAIPLPGVPLSKPLAKFVAQIHIILAWTLLCIATLHVIGALKHHFIDKNNILKRMVR